MQGLRKLKKILDKTKNKPTEDIDLKSPLIEEKEDEYDEEIKEKRNSKASMKYAKF